MVVQLPCETHDIIPGYCCTERIGAGGYGEVWKVSAPGGMTKALKIIYGHIGEERADRELKALERIRNLRHPYLLSLERVEVYQHRLMIVSELADGSLLDRFTACRSKGLSGIPRDELLRYMREAAEALDYLNLQHGLQHLDVKPENILLLAGHAKVADFGLVKDLFDQAHSLVSGLTPVYAAPETFHGKASRWSDQYSLAVVYQQMLTGALPYPGRQAAQLLIQHSRVPPALNRLPVRDRAAVGRALQLPVKNRFENCMAFVLALEPPAVSASGSIAARPIPDESSEPKNDDTRSTKGLLTSIDPHDAPQATHAVTQQLLGHALPTSDIAAPSPAAAVAVVPVRRSVRHLQPDSSRSQSTSQPVSLVIGVGQTGARVLRKLRLVCDAEGVATPNEQLQLMVLDTDYHTVRGLLPDEEVSQVPYADLVHIPLRRPEQLRREPDRYLSWLSRRWLYNTRPTSATEGLRPLGRLAWFDHQDRIRKVLVSRLERCGAGPTRTAGPRVFLVGSAAGGTSGMIFDMAKMVRQALSEAGCGPPNLTTILLHSTTPQPRQRDLALANTFATLNELRHLACYGETFDLKATLRSPQKIDRPWDLPLATYFFSLGEELNEARYDARLDEVVHYLHDNLHTPLGLVLNEYRHSPPTPSEHDVWLRSFRRLWWPARVGDESWADALKETLQSALVLSDCGYDQRSFVLAPRSKVASHPLLQRCRESAYVLPGNDGGFACYCEAERLSLVQVARTLCRDCPEVEDAAYRLQTRRDITWSEMPRVEETEE